MIAEAERRHDGARQPKAPASRSQYGPPREWMKTASAQAVCIDGMQLRAVTSSKTMAAGLRSTGGSASGQ